MSAIEVETTVTIDAPPEVVWAFVSDPGRYPEWSVVTDRMTSVEDGPVESGSTYGEVGGLGPMTDESTWVVTEFDPPKRQVHEGDDGTVRTLMTIELDSVEDGAATRLDQSVGLEFPRGMKLLARLLGPLFLRRMASNALAETAGNAKRIVEAEHGSRETDSEAPAGESKS